MHICQSDAHPVSRFAGSPDIMADISVCIFVPDTEGYLLRFVLRIYINV